MPVDRSRTPLYITLIVFVMLSFVLAITTYLFFQQRSDAIKSATPPWPNGRRPSVNRAR